MLSLWSDDVTTTVRLWSLTDDAMVEDGAGAGELTVVTRWGEVEVDGLDAVGVESLRRMGFGPVTLRNALMTDDDDGGGPVEASRVLQDLERVLDRISGAVVHSLGLPDGQQPLLSVEPMSAGSVFRPRPPTSGRVVRLSRLAALRPDRGGLLLERPGTAFRVLLRRAPARAVVAELAAAADPAAVAEETGLSAAVVEEMLSFLIGAGVLVEADQDGRFIEDHDLRLRGLAAHELEFQQHSRARLIRPDDLGDRDIPPVTPARPAGSYTRLPRPDLAARRVEDPTLTDLLETDHHCPALTGDPLSLAQVGELLFRSVRVRSVGRAHLPTPGGPMPGHQASQRPYANIACLYELEVYLTVERCAGLDAGIYHYDALDHGLTRLDDQVDHVRTVLDVGRIAAGSARRPALTLTVTARVGRLSWILPGASLAVALTHCGALQQTLYLVAKAMGLWAHAVPADGARVDELLGLEWPAEVGLAECVVGTSSGPSRSADPGPTDA